MKTHAKAAAGLAFLSTLLAACASASRKPFAPAPSRPDAAAIYFYRQSEMTGMLLKPALSANGAKVGRLANDSCGVAYLPAGETALRSVWPGIPGSARDDSASLAVEPGKSYYVRVRYHQNKSHKVAPGVPVAGQLVYEDRPGLEAVPESEALPQLAGFGTCAEMTHL